VHIVEVMASDVYDRLILAVTRFPAIHPDRWPRFARVTYRTAFRLRLNPGLPTLRLRVRGQAPDADMKFGRWRYGSGPAVPLSVTSFRVVPCKRLAPARPLQVRPDVGPPGSGVHGYLIDKEDPFDRCNERT